MEKPKVYEEGVDLVECATSFQLKDGYTLSYTKNGWVITKDGTNSVMKDDGAFEVLYTHMVKTKGKPTCFYETKEEPLNLFNTIFKGVIVESENGYSVKMKSKTIPIIEDQHQSIDEYGLVGELVDVDIIQYVRVMKGDEEMIIQVPKFANKVTTEIAKEEATFTYNFG